MEDAEEYLIEEIEEERRNRPVIKNAVDLQRARLEKLMKNPDKPVVIPEAPKERDYMQSVPTFVRNVMGSSAGAGSGEFHVYRHLRRKEYARQKYIASKSLREQLDDDYRSKLEQNRMASEAKTAKKRAKRLKKKQKFKERGGKKRKVENSSESKADDDLSNTEDEEDEGKNDDASGSEEAEDATVYKQPMEEIVKESEDEGKDDDASGSEEAEDATADKQPTVKESPENEDTQKDTKNKEAAPPTVTPNPTDPDSLDVKNNDEKHEEIEKKSPSDKPSEEISKKIENNSVEDIAKEGNEVSTEKEETS